jgi:glycosyltransferase involved in cell wall biosynthesis
LTLKPQEGDTPRTRQVLAFSAAFLPGYKAGGPIKSLVCMLEALPDSVKVTLVTADRDLGDSAPYDGLSGRVAHWGPHDVYYMSVRDPRHWINLLRWARRNTIDLIYVNSLWSPLFTVLPIVAHRLGLLKSREVLLAPRGELSPGALGIKSTKKQAFLRGWRPLLRGINPVWQASTGMEEREIHHVFPWAHTVIQINSAGDDPRKNIIASGPRSQFVFISRISEKKNLQLGLQALQLVTCQVDFDIYGPLEDTDYWTTCQSLINALPDNVRATYRGTLRPDQVQETFARYDGFILPTLGENFGHVISESLSAGCPVICSQETPWTEVLNRGGGTTLTELDARSWADEISRRARQTPSQRNHAKRTALDVYGKWRREVEHETAIEHVFDTLEHKDSNVGTNRPRRIALITQNYNGSGGVPAVARWLATGLRGAGFEVEIFNLADSRTDTHSRRLISPTSWGRPSLLVADPCDPQVTNVGANAVELEPLRYLPRADLSIELNRFDLVQIVAGGPSLALAASSCLRPIVLQAATTMAWERVSRRGTTGHPLTLWRDIMTRLISFMERRALHRVDAVLVENVQMLEYVRSVAQTRVLLAPPGIDTGRFRPPSEAWRSSGYLLSVCRLSDPRKGLDRLIRSYALMRTQSASVPALVLAGSGELPSHLTRMITELDLAGCVSVRSDVPEAELASLYQGASVYLQASHEEGLGISVMEAMACGLPVVSTVTAGTLETVIHGKTGWLVNQNSHVEGTIATRALSVLDSDGSAMSTSARRRAELMFSNQVTISRFLEVYDQLIRCDVSAADEN